MALVIIVLPKVCSTKVTISIILTLPSWEICRSLESPNLAILLSENVQLLKKHV